ncbi:MAG TPA: hypothetical protein VFD49_04705 [Candidatus Dormibacteraeota bacterium]|nr:hypothetical protein [Candidatus Dormibacteraeota bacterium]
MLPPQHLAEITIKVPGPFAGVADLGFSARYPEQVPFAPLRDVPLWIEGPARPMQRLAARLRLLAEASRSAHGWTQPIVLSDEVVVMAFQDRSGRLQGHGQRCHTLEYVRNLAGYVLNLVRPVVFPFLQDCAEIANLRLTEQIEMDVRQAERQIATLTLDRGQIAPSNGEDLLA